MKLPPRQTEVMRMLVQGGSYEQIAQRMGLSENTIKRHARMVFMKFGVSGVNARSALAAQALITGMVHMPKWTDSDAKLVTLKEKRVLLCLARGMDNDEIQAELGFCPNRALFGMRDKLKTRNRVNLVTRGYRAGLWTAADLPPYRLVKVA